MKKIMGMFLTWALMMVILSVPAQVQGAESSSSAPADTVGNSHKSPLTLTYGITTDPDHLNPFQATTADSRSILFNIFEGLLKPSPDGKVRPAVAKSFEISDDFKSYTFILNDIRFHDGQKVTVQDVKYSIEQAIQYKLAGMEAISSVTINGDDEITIHLLKPDSEFYYSLTTAIVPQDYENQNIQPIGTGPFKFESYSPQQQLVLVKNTDYWNPELPKVDKVIFKIKGDMNTIFLDLQAGSLDIGILNSTLASQLDPDNFDVIYANSNAVQVFCLNNAAKPLDNILVRQAISYVVSADEITQLAHDGRAVRAGSAVIPALGEGYNSNLDHTYVKNVELAKQLLDQAGYPHGFDLTITVPSSYQQHIDTAQVIVNQLAEINITAQIEQVDWPTWLSNTYTNRQYETTVISVDGITLSPRSYLFRYTSDDSLNFINYSNQTYDELFQKSLTTNDDKARTEIYHQLQKLLSDQAASVFICDIASPRVFRKGIKGFKPYPLYIIDASTIYFE